MADLTFGGGINNTDDFAIAIDECITGQNFKLDARRGSLQPRPPQDLLTTAANGSTVTGLLQLVNRAGTESTLVAAGTTVYKWATPTLVSSVATITAGAKLRDSYFSLDDVLVISDLHLTERMAKWDGTTYSALKTALLSGDTTSVSTLTRSGSTATAIDSSHGYSSTDLVTIAGADQGAYNGQVEITVSDADTFTYPVSGTPATPATGTITADLSPDLFAKYSVVHQGRVWLFNVTVGATETPHLCLASAFEEPESYSTSTRGAGQPGGTATTLVAFFLLTPDLRPINGVVEFLGQLIISTESGRLFKLTGSDATDFNWLDFYSGSAAAGIESITSIGNDVIYMKEGGGIDLLSSTDRFGDVSADDISRWIPEEVAAQASPITVYDQHNQVIMFFLPGKVLVLDKDALVLRETSPWSKWVTGLPSSFTTKAARAMRLPGTLTETCLWGDDAGQVFNVNGTGQAGDGGSHDLVVIRVSRRIEELASANENLTGRLVYRRRGAFNVALKATWDEEFSEPVSSVPLKGPSSSGIVWMWNGLAYWNGEMYWNQGTVSDENTGDEKVTSVGFDLVGKGPGFFLTLTAETAANFEIAKLSFDER